MPADLSAILAAAERVLDDRYAIAAHGRTPDPMQRDAIVLAEFVRGLLSLDVHPDARATVNDDGMVVHAIAPGVCLKFEPEDARRRAADLLRAAEQAERMEP